MFPFLLGVAAIPSALGACSSSSDEAPPAAPSVSAAPSASATAVPQATNDAGVVPRAVSQARVVDLGEVPESGELTLDVPADTLGFNVVVEGVGIESQDAVGIFRVTSPSGEVVHDGFTPSGGDHRVSLSSLGEAFVAVAVPQSEAKSANPPEPGKWRLAFGSVRVSGSDLDAGPPIRMRAQARIQMGAKTGFAGGRLDLHVHVPHALRLGRGLVSADNAARSESMTKRIDLFYESLSRLFSIDRGKVFFDEAPGTLRMLTTLEQLEAAHGLAKDSGDPQAMHVLFTNAMDVVGASVAGRAPGIPGSAGRGGTPISTVILEVEDDSDTELEVVAMVHELGHFVGLSHTTEVSGTLADPLTDTERCDALADGGSFDTCPDKGNVMFPLTASSFLKASPAQRAIFHGSPVYHAYTSGVPNDVAAGGTSRGQDKALHWARAGRPLTNTERWLAAHVCTRVPFDPHTLASERGRGPAIAELRAAADDADLAGPLRRRAKLALDVLSRGAHQASPIR